MNDVALRLVVLRPPAGVRFCVQRGRADLVPPTASSADALTFDLHVRVARGAQGELRVQGAGVQGPATAPFIYVNSGTRAGQADSPWDRRAKVPLAGLTSALLDAAIATPGSMIVAEIEGTARTGGPACATVPLLHTGWRVVPPPADRARQPTDVRAPRR